MIAIQAPVASSFCKRCSYVDGAAHGHDWAWFSRSKTVGAVVSVYYALIVPIYRYYYSIIAKTYLCL